MRRSLLTCTARGDDGPVERVLLCGQLPVAAWSELTAYYKRQLGRGSRFPSPSPSCFTSSAFHSSASLHTMQLSLIVFSFLPLLAAARPLDAPLLAFVPGHAAILAYDAENSTIVAYDTSGSLIGRVPPKHTRNFEPAEIGKRYDQSVCANISGSDIQSSKHVFTPARTLPLTCIVIIQWQAIRPLLTQRVRNGLASYAHRVTNSITPVQMFGDGWAQLDTNDAAQDFEINDGPTYACVNGVTHILFDGQ